MKFTSLLAVFLAVWLGISASAPTLPATAKGTTTDWSWLANTYWIVPSPNLPAVLFSASSQELVPVSDQTVYHITGYQNGYFWGKNVGQLNGESALVSCSSLIGSVTPDGQVLLGFITTNTDGTSSLQQGFGTMVKQGGKKSHKKGKKKNRKKSQEWTMLNQTGTTSFAHWAYMVQSQPGDASWDSLPGVGVSVEDFLAQCPGDGPQPV